MRIIVPALGALALLAACEARIGTDKASEEASETQGSASASSGSTGEASAQGEAKEGQLSIDAPGFEMKLNIPKALAGKAEIDSNSGILYPGSSLSGMHVEANDTGGSQQSGVELRFTSSDAPAKLAAWYRDPARAGEFTVGSVRQNGAGFAVQGTERGDGDPFDLTLNPRSGGGTDGVLRLRDRS